MYYYSKLWLSVKFFSIISGEEGEVCNRARARVWVARTRSQKGWDKICATRAALRETPPAPGSW